MNVNDYLARSYGPQPCWDLVSDVLINETGVIPLTFRTINRSVREMASEFRIALSKGNHGFAQIDAPVDYCIVLLGKNTKIGIHHCGIYFAGKVLHAMPESTMHEELSSIRDRFEVIQFWAKS